jgi:hypothetical protein
MSKPKILIIGCGAVGLTQGYHLSVGADITYLVRPGRSAAFTAPKKLFDYKVNKLRIFDNYRVIESVSEAAREKFYCVFDTLDGHTARSEGGIATLRSVGELIRDHVETFVTYDAIGIDMEQHYATTMGIARERILFVGSMLAHQPTPSISVPATADRDLIAQADMLYAHQDKNVGLIVINNRPELTKKLEEVYNKNGTVVIQRMPGVVGEVVLLVIPQLVVWHVAGWGEFSHLRKNSELWNLLLRAQGEILGLPRSGWTGWLMSWVFGSWVTAKMMTMPAEGSLPLVYHEFSAFHHGGKVIEQDIGLLEDFVADGEKSKHKMVALREVCRRARAMQRRE